MTKQLMKQILTNKGECIGNYHIILNPSYVDTTLFLDCNCSKVNIQTEWYDGCEDAPIYYSDWTNNWYDNINEMLEDEDRFDGSDL